MEKSLPTLCSTATTAFTVKYAGKMDSSEIKRTTEFENNRLGFIDLTLKAPITTAADDNFLGIFLNFDKNKVRYLMRIVSVNSHGISCLNCYF